MKTIFNLSQLSILIIVLSSSAVLSSESVLNPVEKKTVNVMKSLSQDNSLKVTIQNVKQLEKDTQFMSSHQRENAIAGLEAEQTNSVVNSISKQFFRAFFGVYEQEVRTKILTLDLSDDEAQNTQLAVSSYDRNNFELTMRARKNKEKLASEQGVEVHDLKEVKGKWKVRPRVGNPGVHVNYLSSKFNIEMRLTSAEQVINLHRNLKDISVDVFYNINIKNQESSLTVSKPIVSNLNLQVQSVGRGVNAFGNADERVSLNFGKIF